MHSSKAFGKPFLWIIRPFCKRPVKVVAIRPFIKLSLVSEYWVQYRRVHVVLFPVKCPFNVHVSRPSIPGSSQGVIGFRNQNLPQVYEYGIWRWFHSGESEPFRYEYYLNKHLSHILGSSKHDFLMFQSSFEYPSQVYSAPAKKFTCFCDSAYLRVFF